ncbi:hypothetical protein CVV38_03405 [Candidatus Peregrinibacteria bacterium HGW-Peregrinibacteria-1]|jgi:hypothetical protein|nr:MAG: hypothetical protein CVV38_03405 [Candidatus Peregrinibacteria bacterium HGW-Peregrinibacteria-1]
MFFDVLANLSLHTLPVFLSALGMFLFGIIWYSPFLFGGLHAKSMGLTKDLWKKKRKARHWISIVRAMLMEFVLALVLVVVLVSLLQFNSDMFGILKKGDFADAEAFVWGMYLSNILLTFVIWIGFVAMTGINEILRGDQKFFTFLWQSAGLLFGMEVATLIWTYMAPVIMMS